MICPYCGEELDLYDNITENIDIDTIQVSEHYACYNCDRTFWRDVFYQVTKRGELRE